MKKELTIEHLAAYLPYGVIGRESLTSLDYRLTGLSSAGPIWAPAYDMHDFPRCSMTSRTDCKPILRPLSDLTKEITHNGETFVPFEKIERMGYRMHPSIWDNVGLFALSYWVVCELHAMHFDTFGLIEAGLAIDINTIKK